MTPYAQSKLVTVLRGSAQFFWLSTLEKAPGAEVNSVILNASASSLYTPGICAHGMLCLADDTQFILRMSAPISIAHRREISMLSKAMTFDFAGQFCEGLLSPRDIGAPEWGLHGG